MGKPRGRAGEEGMKRGKGGTLRGRKGGREGWGEEGKMGGKKKGRYKMVGRKGKERK